MSYVRACNKKQAPDTSLGLMPCSQSDTILDPLTQTVVYI